MIIVTTTVIRLLHDVNMVTAAEKKCTLEDYVTTFCLPVTDLIYKHISMLSCSIFLFISLFVFEAKLQTDRKRKLKSNH